MCGRRIDTMGVPSLLRRAGGRTKQATFMSLATWRRANTVEIGRITGYPKLNNLFASHPVEWGREGGGGGRERVEMWCLGARSMPPTPIKILSSFGYVFKLGPTSRSSSVYWGSRDGCPTRHVFVVDAAGRRCTCTVHAAPPTCLGSSTHTRCG